MKVRENGFNESIFSVMGRTQSGADLGEELAPFILDNTLIVELEHSDPVNSVQNHCIHDGLD